MKRSIYGIGVVSMAMTPMRVESFEKRIELSSEMEKLGNGYWVFVIFFFFFFLLGFVIDMLLLFLRRSDL